VESHTSQCDIPRSPEIRYNVLSPKKAAYNTNKQKGPVLRQEPNKLVINSAKQSMVSPNRSKPRSGIAPILTDIYQNERILKSTAYQVTQIAPDVFSLFNVSDRDLHLVRRRIVSQGLSERATRQFEPIMLQQVNVFLAKLLAASHKREPVVSHCVGLRVYDPGSIPSLTHSRLVRTRLSAHNASRRRYRTQFP
jgi:hypothetical protein